MDQETRAYLDDMRQEMNRRFDVVDQRFEQVDRRFGEVDERFDEVRRHFGVLLEHSRHESRIIAEMVAANTEAIADLRARLDAR